MTDRGKGIIGAVLVSAVLWAAVIAAGLWLLEMAMPAYVLINSVGDENRCGVGIVDLTFSGRWLRRLRCMSIRF
jgi:hypothetical protein